MRGHERELHVEELSWVAIDDGLELLEKPLETAAATQKRQVESILLPFFNRKRQEMDRFLEGCLPLDGMALREAF